MLLTIDDMVEVKQLLTRAEAATAIAVDCINTARECNERISEIVFRDELKIFNLTADKE